MDIDEILRCLERDTGKFPREALQAAIERRDEIIPRLLETLEETISNADELVRQADYMAYEYAMYLLAQFREKRAYPLFVRFVLLPPKVVDDLLGDTISMGLGRMLAAVQDGDLDPIKRLVESPDVDEYVRDAALVSLVCLVVTGELAREDFVAYCKSLFEGKLEREYSYIWNGLVICALRVWPEELLDDIRQAYQDGLADPFIVGEKDIEQALATGKSQVLENLRSNRHYSLIANVIEEMEWWACFEETREQKPSEPPPTEELPPSSDVAGVEELGGSDVDGQEQLEGPDPGQAEPETMAPSRPRIGRNEPCPCGSGKKYKRCCGR